MCNCLFPLFTVCFHQKWIKKTLKLLFLLLSLGEKQHLLFSGSIFNLILQKKKWDTEPSSKIPFQLTAVAAS